MTAIDYDCEFLEDGRSIELISIGMVADDGREFYGISKDVDRARLAKHPWLMEHVVPLLPLALTSTGELVWNTLHPDYGCTRWRGSLAEAVAEFILAAPDPQLWSWYAAYDHVALCQLWGRMVDLPAGIPRFTNDLKQECERLGNPKLPSMAGAQEHNALSDAREVRFRRLWLKGFEERKADPGTGRDSTPAVS